MTDPSDDVVTRAPAPQPDVLDTSPQGGQRARGVASFFSATERQVIPRQRLERLSLRTRLLAILVTGLLTALVVTGYGVQFILARYLIGQIDGELLDNYNHFVNDPHFAGGLLNEGGPPTAFATHVSVDRHPELDIGRSGRPGVVAPTFPELSPEQAGQIAGHVYVITAPDGRSWRAVSFPQTLIDRQTRAEYNAAVTLALPSQGALDAINELRLSMTAVGIGVIALGAGVGWLAVRRSFRPLIEVEETAAAIATGDLSRRVPEYPASTEVGSLTHSLNSMLTQIESAFRAREASEARTRRFAADASHELRTPLVSIRGFAELYRQGAVPAEDVPRTMKRIEDEAKRMGSLVEDLLLLARLDEQRPGRHDPVDLMVLGGDAVHDARGLDADRTVRLVGPDGGSPRRAVVTGDEDRLRQVVANLVANAVRHTPAGSPIEVAVGTDGDHAVLEVRDHGQGLAPEQAQKVFERFYRVDASRQRTSGGGSGLGLSIVAAVVASHAGRVEVAPTPGGGATFRVVLPARPADTEEATNGADPRPVQAGQPRQNGPATAATAR
ncbi:MAG TPA: HAMP domain-containing sensor histidine kinase [Kineosporiaceae bacterium]